MVRAAVRTLTLNVYCIKDPAVQAFVVSKPASNYFNELAIFVAEQCQVSLFPLLSPKGHGLDPICTHVMESSSALWPAAISAQAYHTRGSEISFEQIISFALSRGVT